MKIELGNIKIKEEQDVINLRLKIIKIFDILFDDYIFAIKASSLLSTLVKRIKMEYSTVNIDSFIRSEKSPDGHVYIKISSNKSISLPHLLKNYNSAINLKELNGCLLLEIPGRLKLENLELVRQIYSKPSLDDLIQELKVKNKDLEESFENLKRAKDLNARMESELEVGKNIQMSMLPVDFPINNKIDLHATLIPAREVGGDFYDFYFIDESNFCFVVGDVSGKGVPAALFMAVTKTLLKSQASNEVSTANILTHVNNEIARDNDAYMFITIFMAILDIDTGELVYTNAGHNPSFILNPKQNSLVKLTDLHGPVVGAIEEITYKETKLSLSKGDVVFTYTDGVTEAQNLENELFSDARLEELLKARLSKTSIELVTVIADEVKKYEEGKEQADDITVMAIKYKENPDTISMKKVSLEISNELKEIAMVIDQFEEFAENNRMPQANISKFNIVFDELLSNIISYAYTDDQVHLIQINIELRNNQLVITITDDGIPFNPFTMDTPDIKQSIEERSIGGLGIHLVKHLMDEYTYKRDVNNNIITLIKHNINV